MSSDVKSIIAEGEPSIEDVNPSDDFVENVCYYLARPTANKCDLQTMFVKLL